MKRVVRSLIMLLVLAGALTQVGWAQDRKVLFADGGNSHTIALRADGTVWLSGGNGAGQLGDGTWVKSNIPSQLVSLFDVVSVAAGSYHTLAVLRDGTVWAWGWNGYGLLGDETFVDKATPIQVRDPSDPSTFLTHAIAAAAGEKHSLVLKADGTVWAWGYNGNGQLGDGTWIENRHPVKVKDPTDASGYLTGVTGIAAGAWHSIALKADRTVWTWGSQGYNQLGRNNWVPSNNQHVAGQAAGLTNVIAIAGGWEHTVALKGDGTVWAAGRNLEGQLGDGTTLGSSLSPPKFFVQAIHATGYLTGIVAIGANDRYTLAVKSNGTAWGWGSNYGGVLCDGTSGVGPGKTVPVQMKDPLDTSGFLTNVKAVGAGDYHSLVIKNDGTLWGCGWNSSGQLGDESWTDRQSPVQAMIPGPGLMLLSGPAHVTPGEEATFIVEYENTFDVTLTDAVIAVELPRDVVYASSSRNGSYWTDRHQVFWKLGNLAPGAKDKLAVKLGVSWGLPLHSVGSLRAHIGATNLETNINVDDYLHSPIEVKETLWLDTQEVQALFRSNPELETLINRLGNPSQYFSGMGLSAHQVMLSNGTSYIQLSYLDLTSMRPVFLYRASHAVWGERYDGDKLVMFDVNGEHYTASDGISGCWGTWEKGEQDQNGQVLRLPLCRCLINCQLQKIETRIDPETWGRTSEPLLKKGSDSWACLECKRSGGRDSEPCLRCLRQAREQECDAKPVSAKIDRGSCLAECRSKPDLYACTPSTGTKNTDIEVCTTVNDWDAVAYSRCDPDTRRYTRGLPGRLPIKAKCGPLELCKQQADHKAACVSIVPCPILKGLLNVQGLPSAKALSYGAAPLSVQPISCPTGQAFVTRGYEVVVAHDPNAKYVDVTGYVTPGQKLTYTITYENEGAGAAYGVFIVDTLDPNLDASTVSVSNGGTWSPLSRLVSWGIGTVAPRGQGAVSFSAKVKSGVPADTQIVNSAEVYFPSANEITPTNMVVSVARGIAAAPQTVATVSQVPKAITLTGRDAGGGALSYQITSPPLFGILSGTPPLVTYASMAEFSGQDEFLFTVSNGTTASDPAKVRINVTPNPADKTPPTVVGTTPVNGDTGVRVESTPVSTDPLRYIPTITASFSEPIDAATITASTFTVSGGITGNVSYDEVGRTASFKPNKALSSSVTYTVTLTTGIKDKVGNALVSKYSWQFATEGTLAGNALTVSVSAGNGVVTSAPAGIACGMDCRENYAAGTSVRLFATPSAGSVFGGWSGACSGMGVCTLSMRAAENVAARFSASGAGSLRANEWVQKSYVAYYGRPADPAGLGYWAERMDREGGSLSSIITAFGSSDEFNRRYGGLTYTALVTKIYQQALARDPDPAGLAYYVGELQAGRRTLQSIALDVLNGATRAPDSTVVANKLDVANHFTGKCAAGCAYGGEQSGANALTAITPDPATVMTAKLAIESRCGP